MKPSIQIIQPGFYTTIQDGGRRGYAHLGVPESGAMDQEAYQLANALLNNQPDAAVLECTLQGPEIRFDSDTYIVVTGGITEATLDGKPFIHGAVAFAQAQQLLKIGAIVEDVRCYIGIAGGIASPTILKSRSMYAPLTNFSLKKGEVLSLGVSNYGKTKGARIKPLTFSPEKSTASLPEITVYPAPEFGLLNTKQQQDCLKPFTVSKYWNRMAVQLEEPLPNTLKSMITAPVIPGTVQCTPSGILIVLLRDCQTTGGYPRILQVSKEGLNVLSRFQKGDRFRWKLLS